MKRPAATASLGISITLAAMLPAAGSDRPASQLVATCASCHRLDNRPTGIPPIVGLGAGQIAAMLKAFRSHPQASHIMNAISRTLTDGEIESLASYLGALGQEVRDR